MFSTFKQWIARYQVQQQMTPQERELADLYKKRDKYLLQENARINHKLARFQKDLAFNDWKLARLNKLFKKYSEVQTEFDSSQEAYRAIYEISGCTSGVLNMSANRDTVYYPVWYGFEQWLALHGLQCSVELVWDKNHRNVPGGLITQPKHTYLMKISKMQQSLLKAA